MKTIKQKRLMRGLTLRGNIYWAQVQKNRKRTRMSLETSDLAEAIRKLAQIKQTPMLIPSGSELIHTMERFVKAKRAMRIQGARSGWAARTMDKLYQLKIFARFCGEGMTPERVTSNHVKRFYDHRMKERNAQTAYGNYMTIRSFFNWCVDERLTYTNPCLAVKVESPAPRPRKDFCEPELVAKLIDECPRDDLKFVLYCGFHCGMRRLEICEAVPWWFDLKRAYINLRKTPRIDFKDLTERDVPMTSEMRDWLQGEYGLREPFMLHPEKTDGIRYRWDFRLPFEGYMKQQGCEWVTPHIMRHTFATLLASMNPNLGGPSDFEIMNWMGIDYRTYQRTYAKLRPRQGGTDKAFRVGATD